MTNKTYRSISEVAELLDLKNHSSGKLSTHTLRYWEKEFKQIKPKIYAGKRRYYDENSIVILKKIKDLLKVKGMTIKGAKKLLNDDNSDLDVSNNIYIKTKINLKNKINKISKLIKNIKKNK